MKYIILAFLVFISMKLYSQDKMFQIYEDNDFLNIALKGTDKGYTNGTKFSLFYEKNYNNFFIDRIMPKAGDNSQDVYGWGIMQVMYTPNDLWIKQIQPYDYPWSGGLFAIHSLYSYNKNDGYGFQTDILTGVIGPLAMDRITQTWIHNMSDYYKPEGWGNQVQNDVILNVNFKYEKMILDIPNIFELIYSARGYVGTLVDQVGTDVMLRVGDFQYYFQDFMSHYLGSNQFYLFGQPQLDYTFHNSLLQGGFFSKESLEMKIRDEFNPMVKLVRNINCGAVLGFKKFSITYTQSYTSHIFKELDSHSVGNFSIYFKI
jgi:lipid A 3-O-deacylase